MKTITIVFAVLCASQLYGMEQPQQAIEERKALLEGSQLLPLELQQEIIKNALLASKSRKETITAIETACIIMELPYKNLSNFTRLVHILAKQLTIKTETIAMTFEMPITQEYLKINNDLTALIKSGSKNNKATTALINKGADFNFNAMEFDCREEKNNNPLHLAVRTNNSELVGLLLQWGAKPGKTDIDINSKKHLDLDVIDKEANMQPSFKKFTIVTRLKQLYNAPPDYYPLENAEQELTQAFSNSWAIGIMLEDAQKKKR